MDPGSTGGSGAAEDPGADEGPGADEDPLATGSSEVSALEALRAASAAITSMRDLDEIFDAFGEHVGRVVPFHSLRLFLHDEETSEIYPVALSTTVPEYEDVDLSLPQLRMPVGHGVTGRIAATRRAEVIDDMAADPDVYYPPGVPPVPRESYIGVPLVFRDELIGVFTLSRRETGEFDVHELALMEVLAVPLAATLAQARAQKAWRRARLQEQRLRSLHRAFVGNISHELRTPLTTALGFLELATTQAEDDVTRNALLDRAQEGLGRLRLLIERLLEAVAVEANRQELVLAEHRVGDLVDRAIAQIDVPASRVAVEGDVEATAVADGVRLTHVIAELVENAAVHGPDAGAIAVRVEETGSTIAITVVDEGEGVREEIAEDIFDRFVQGDPGLTRQGGGAGIGLSLARSTARWHGGELELRPGSPTTFAVILPRLETGGTHA